MESPLLFLPASLGLVQFSALVLSVNLDVCLACYEPNNSPAQTVHLPAPGGQHRKKDCSTPHSIPSEGVPAAGKKFTIFCSDLPPQSSAVGDAKDKTLSLDFQDHESDSGTA